MNNETVKERLMKIAKERGYEEHARSGDGDMYIMTSENGLVLTLWISDNTFKLQYLPKSFVCSLTTDKCGSFDKEEHFKKIENAVLKYSTAMILADYE
jgi:hypothetical protein